jgi:hypothetical protein
MVLFWYTAFARAVFHDNSRFGALNSRLGGNKFPFGRRRELADNGLICFTLLVAETAFLAGDRENSRFYGNNWELAK